MSKYNQKGFAALEVLAIIVVVGLIVGGGYLVMKNKNKTEPKATISASQPVNDENISNSTQQGSNAYLNIKEWGIRLVVPEAYRGDLYYGFSENVKDNNGLGLSLKSVVTVAPGCAPEKLAEVAEISRYKADDRNAPDVSDVPSGGSLIKKVGGYKYFDVGPQAACYSSSQESAVVKALKGRPYLIGKARTEMLNTIEAL